MGKKKQKKKNKGAGSAAAAAAAAAGATPPPNTTPTTTKPAASTAAAPPAARAASAAAAPSSGARGAAGAGGDAQEAVFARLPQDMATMTSDDFVYGRGAEAFKAQFAGTRPRPPIPSNPRYSHALQLLQDQPEIMLWVLGLADLLQQNNFVVVDNFLQAEDCQLLRDEVVAAHRDGRLNKGLLAGGRSGKNLRYSLASIRGDLAAWFKGDPCHDGSTGRLEADAGDLPNCWNGTAMQKYMRRMDTLVELLATQIPEMQTIESRSEAMVTCYPGNGARYIKHCDNPNRNGRKVTAIYYLNPAWQPGDGGELRVFSPASEHHRDIAPIGDRLIVFFSNARVPHEVLPSNVDRYAVTHWYMCYAERREAEASLDGRGQADDVRIERERIQQEIAKWEQQYGDQVQREQPEGGPTDEDDSGGGGGAGGSAEPERGAESGGGVNAEALEQKLTLTQDGEAASPAPRPQSSAPPFLSYQLTVDAARGQTEVTLQVPGIASAAELEVDIQASLLEVSAPARAAGACIPLDPPVDPDHSSVKLKKKRQTLLVVMPHHK